MAMDNIVSLCCRSHALFKSLSTTEKYVHAINKYEKGNQKKGK